MGESGQASSSMFSRHRNPNFRQSEIKTLVRLVEKYKNLVLNKSTNSAANYAKEKGWARIASEFNREGCDVERSADVLKTKWENLKRSAKKISKDVMDDDSEVSKDDIYRSIAMICATEIENTDTYDDECDDLKPWADDSRSIASADCETPNGKRNIKCETPSMNDFSPQECRVLLQCVRQEKTILFSKSPLVKRHQAWKRIVDSFNNQTHQNRTSKELNSKFNKMKSMATKINIKGYFKDVKRKKKYEELSKRKKCDGDVNSKIEIKVEPIVECANDFDIDDSDEEQTPNAVKSPPTSNGHISFIHDPLNNVNSSDSGLGLMSESKDVARLKMDLLNYKMETARLERKRIETALKADEKERELRGIETSLRLRAARLEAVAAAARLPPSHPALHYTTDERAAHTYLSDHLDIG